MDDKREIIFNEYWLDLFKVWRCVDKKFFFGMCKVENKGVKVIVLVKSILFNFKGLIIKDLIGFLLRFWIL